MARQAGSERSRHIVVGIDGSEHSKVALAWAAQEATISGSSLMVLITWNYPNSFGYPVPWPTEIDFAAEAKSVLDETVTAVLGLKPEIAITTEVIEGRAALALEDASKEAALVVVGSRGHGEFAGMLLGSVNEFLATHAHCPVVIIRGDGRHPAAT